MGLAAVSFAIVTILIGTLVLADLGSNPAARPVVGVHVAAAILGAIILAVAAFGSSSAIAAAALVVLLVAVGLGILTWRRTTARPDPDRKSVSSGMLIAHGAGAALTVLFVLLAAVH